jgi:hypothetical protein
MTHPHSSRPYDTPGRPWKWLVVVAAGVLLVGAVARLGSRRADIRLSYVSGSDPAAIRLVTADQQVLALPVSVDATDRHFSITTTGSGVVSMTPPYTSQGGRLVDLAQYSATEGDWGIAGDWSPSTGWRGGQWRASQPGSILVWSGYAPDVELEFVTSPGGGGVNIMADGVALDPITLDGPEGTKRVHAMTRSRLATRMIDVSDLPATVELPSDAQPTSLTIVSDGHTVYTAALPAELRAISVPSVPHVSSLTYASRAAVLVARASFVNGLFVTLGIPLCLSLFAQRSIHIAVAVSWAAGMSLVILLTTSLTYVVPGLHAMLLALIVISGAGIAVITTNKAAAWRALLALTSARWLLVLLAAGLSGALFAFAPAITEDGWFLGQSLTDSMDYIAWSETLVHSSLKDARIAPWRIADLTTLFTISTLTGVDTREGYAIAAFTLFAMLPLLVHAILESLNTNTATAACGACLATFLSIFPQLFNFSYFAQYVNAFVLHAGILSACILLNACRFRSPTDWWTTQGALAAPLALGVAMYPYQAIPPLVVLAWLFVAWLRHRTRSGAALLATQLTLAAVLSNRSLAIGIDFFQSKISTFGFLDALARNIVFPYHATFKFVTIVAGCRDISMVHTYWPSLVVLTGDAPWWMPMYAYTPAMVAVVVAELCAIVAGLYALATSRTAPAFYVVVVYGMFALATLALFVTNHTYSYGKYMLACGTLAAVPVAAGITFLVGRIGVSFWWPAAGLAALMFFNMGTTVLDQSLTTISRASPFLFNKHTHLAAIDVSVRDLDRWCRTLPANTRIAVIGNYSRGGYADTDRVLYNRMLHAMRGNLVDFHQCVCPLYTAAFVFGTTNETMSRCDYDFFIVFRGYESRYADFLPKQCDSAWILSNDTFRVYRGLRGTGICVANTASVSPDKPAEHARHD